MEFKDSPEGGLLDAFKTVRDKYDAGQGSWQSAIDEVNTKTVLDNSNPPKRVLLVRHQIGRLLRLSDVTEIRRKRRLRKLLDDIETIIKNGYKNDRTIVQVKAEITTRLG